MSALFQTRPINALNINGLYRKIAAKSLTIGSVLHRPVPNLRITAYNVLLVMTLQKRPDERSDQGGWAAHNSHKQGPVLVDFKHSDVRTIDDAFQADPGYVLNFSDKTFREYFDDEFRIDIDQPKFRTGGTSKMNRLRTFCRIEDAAIVARALRSLWDYREGTFPATPRDAAIKTRLFELISRIEGNDAVARTDAIERFAPDQTLEELVAAIERDILADRPVAALDRLHTYCAKKFGHLLDRRSVEWDRSEPLHSRVGKYVKAVNQERPLREMTQQIMKNAIGVFDKFNHIRNNQSLAHDNEIIDKAEARFIFDSVSAFLRFVKNMDNSERPET